MTFSDSTSGLGRVDGWRGGGPASSDLYPLRFQPPLGEPDVRISRIRLSPGSCLRTRKVARLRQQVHQPQSQDQELVGDAARPLPAHLVLPAQPPAEPRTRGPLLRLFVEPHRTRLLPSLSHAVPYGVSRPFPVLPDSFVNHLALAPASTIPRPGVLSSAGITRHQRYYDPIRHPRGPVPRLTTPPLASAARQPPQGASRVAHNPSFAHAVATTPAEPLGAYVVRFPNGGGLPRVSGGSASALPFSRPAQRSLLVTAYALAESLTDPFTSEASTDSLPPRPFRLLPAGTTSAGWDSHPLGPRTFARHTEICGLATFGRRPLSGRPVLSIANKRCQMSRLRTCRPLS